MQARESLFLQETPLFLRFINMIINDATVQLDEGLEVANLQKVIDIIIIIVYFRLLELG